MTEKELRDYLPFAKVEDGCVLSKRGDITFGWKVWLPTAFTVNEPGYDSIIMSVLQAYRQLPDWCVIHKQDVYHIENYVPQEAEGFLAQSYQEHFRGRPYLNGHCYLFLTFSSKGVVKGSNKSSGFFGFSDLKKLTPEFISECASHASVFASVLDNNPLINLVRLTTDDFLRVGPNGRDEGIIPDFMRMYHTSGPDYNLEFHPDHVRYGDDILKVWYVEDSDSYPGQVSSVTPVHGMSSGASQVFLSGGSPLGFSLRIPHIVNRYIIKLPKNEVEAELDQRRRLMTSFSLYSSACAVHSQELEQYLLDAARDSTITIKCFMDVEAWCPASGIADVQNAIVSAFADLGVSVVEETRIAPVLNYAAIPGNAADLGYDNFLNSEITAFLCHGLWDGYDFGIKGGVVHVCDRRTMVPKTIDIQSLARERGYINNMNAVVIGPSGSGKSFTMNSLVQDFYDSGEHVVIIDVGDSYEGQCAVVHELSGGKDGVYNTYDPEHPFSFNPFRGRKDWGKVDADGDQVSSGQDFILSLLKTIYKPEGGWKGRSDSSSVLKFLLTQFLFWWDSGVPSEISEDLADAWKNEKRHRAERNKKKFDESRALFGWKDPVEDIFRREGRGVDPVFDDFYQYVTRIVAPLVKDENFFMDRVPVKNDMLDMDRFGASMAMYARGGEYGFLLNAEEEADLFKSRLTVFEVDKIKDNEDLFPLWVLCIMHSFEDKMRSLSCPKVIVIEEAWKAIATDTMADFIVWMWRTARKFRTSAVVVTQDVNDLVSSPVVREAIIQNSDVKILLDQRSNANKFDRMVELLGLSPLAKNLVLSVGADLLPGYRYKEAFFGIGQDYCNVFAMEVSPEQAVCFESDKTKKRPFLELAKERGSYVQAVKEIVQSRKEKED